MNENGISSRSRGAHRRAETGQQQQRTETEPPPHHLDTCRQMGRDGNKPRICKAFFPDHPSTFFLLNVWDNVILSNTYRDSHQPPATCTEHGRRKRKQKRAEQAPSPVSSSERLFILNISFSYPLLPSHLFLEPTISIFPLQSQSHPHESRYFAKDKNVPTKHLSLFPIVIKPFPARISRFIFPLQFLMQTHSDEIHDVFSCYTQVSGGNTQVCVR